MGGNTSTSAEAANVSADAREERHPNANTYPIKGPKGRSNRPPRLGTIAKNAILPPPEQGVKNRVNEAHMGSIPFKYIIRMDV